MHAGIGWEARPDPRRPCRRRDRAADRTSALAADGPDQIAEYRAALAGVHGVIAVSRQAADGWRRALGPGTSVRAVPNGILPRPAPQGTATTG
ncbi:hypothetical protein FLP41_05140 [Paracoccus marcusii]|uniref:hypothetical protein n=1 Tax=Paracoccus marcusii TaxID=59779 RepID=UPI002ED0CC98|nr:hypothetical protein FLP41_05140 [Paracoccus marcusii]